MKRILKTAFLLLSAGTLSIVLSGCLIELFVDIDVDDILSDTDIEEVDLQHVESGLYTGTHTAGLVKVVSEVTVQEREITRVRIEEHDNMRGGKAETITGDVILAQSLQVDAVSGATISSMVILKSIENALRSGIQEETQ